MHNGKDGGNNFALLMILTGGFSKMMVPYFSKVIKASLLIRVCEIRVLEKERVSVKVNPISQATWEKMQNLFLP